MLARTAILVALLLPSTAEAQFSLDVTQIDPGSQNDGPTGAGVCAKEACRATVPLRIGDDMCVLNLRVGAPGGDGWGQILLALGPCRSGRVRAISGDPFPAKYQLDRFGAASLTISVPIQPQWEGIPGFDDGVLRPDEAGRLDIIGRTITPGAPSDRLCVDRVVSAVRADEADMDHSIVKAGRGNRPKLSATSGRCARTGRRELAAWRRESHFSTLGGDTEDAPDPTLKQYPAR